MPRMKKVVCYDCDGTGHILAEDNRRLKTCPKCGGKGILSVPITNYDKYAQRKDSLASLLSRTNFYYEIVNPQAHGVYTKEFVEDEILKWLTSEYNGD